MQSLLIASQAHKVHLFTNSLFLAQRCSQEIDGLMMGILPSSHPSILNTHSHTDTRRSTHMYTRIHTHAHTRPRLQASSCLCRCCPLCSNTGLPPSPPGITFLLILYNSAPGGHSQAIFPMLPALHPGQTGEGPIPIAWGSLSSSMFPW
jgi:hypothetical protein